MKCLSVAIGVSAKMLELGEGGKTGDGDNVPGVT